MPRYEEKMPVNPSSHPMVEDAMDTSKGVEMDLTNVDANWKERRDSLLQLRNAHLSCADLLSAAINRINYFLREDNDPVGTTVSNEVIPAYIRG